MKFNIRKAKKDVGYQHYDALLEKNRKEKGHTDNPEGTYEDALKNNRKDKEIVSITEKQLSKHHTEDKKTAKITERWLDDEKKRDDSTHKTNTLPINELAEEAQRKRIKARGDGNGLDKDHFQQYKKEDLGLSEKNFGRISDVNHKLDALLTQYAGKRITNKEKQEIEALQKTRDSIIKEII